MLCGLSHKPENQPMIWHNRRYTREIPPTETHPAGQQIAPQPNCEEDVSTGATSPPKSQKPPRKNSNLLITAAIVATLIALFVFGTQIYTDILWFDQLGFISVFITQNIYKIATFSVATITTALAVWSSLFFAYKKGEDPQPTNQRTARPRPARCRPSDRRPSLAPIGGRCRGQGRCRPARWCRRARRVRRSKRGCAAAPSRYRPE